MSAQGRRAASPVGRGELWERLLDVTERALASGALHPIPTSCDVIEEGGVHFIVRVLDSLARKEEDRKKRAAGGGPPPNPFLPYDDRLYVGDLPGDYVALLNKYNVVERHLLLVTREFEEQERYLTVRDCAALLRGLAEYNSLAFYNGGVTGGASQPHKHLQLVPLPLAADGPPVPVEAVLPPEPHKGDPGSAPSLPFVHAYARMRPEWIRSPASGAAPLHAHLGRMLVAAGLEEKAPPEGAFQSGPYNLLVTREWALLVPRSGEFFAGASVNALGFAGALLVRDAAQKVALVARGPMGVLESVAIPFLSTRKGS